MGSCFKQPISNENTLPCSIYKATGSQKDVYKKVGAVRDVQRTRGGNTFAVNSTISDPFSQQNIAISLGEESGYYKKLISLQNTTTLLSRNAYNNLSQKEKKLRQLVLNNHALIISYLSEKKEWLNYIAPHYFDQYRWDQGQQKITYFILKVAQGWITLQEKLSKQGAMNTQLFLHVIKSIVSGIIELQRMEVYHQDLRLRNMIVFRGVDIKIIDFDHAILLEESFNNHHFNIENVQMIHFWLNCQEESAEDKESSEIILEHLFKGISRREPQYQQFKTIIYSIKKSQERDLANKTKMILNYLKKYMYISHKQQFIQLLSHMSKLVVIKDNSRLSQKIHENQSQVSINDIAKIAVETISVQEQNNEKGYEEFLKIITAKLTMSHQN